MFGRADKMRGDGLAEKLVAIRQLLLRLLFIPDQDANLFRASTAKKRRMTKSESAVRNTS